MASEKPAPPAPKKEQVVLASTDEELSRRLMDALRSDGVDVAWVQRLTELTSTLDPPPDLVVIDVSCEPPDPWHKVTRTVHLCRQDDIPVLVFTSKPGSAAREEGGAFELVHYDRLYGNILRLLGRDVPLDENDPMRE